MSLTWVIIGTIAQLMLAFFLFMLVAFSAGGIVNRKEPLKPIQSSLLNLSIYLLPGLCLVSALLLIYGYRHEWNATTYWWHLLPIAAAAIYLTYAIKLYK